MWVWCKWPWYRRGVPAASRDGNPGRAPCCGTKANKWAQWLKQRGTTRREEGWQPRNTLGTLVTAVPGQCVATEAVSWLTSQHFWDTNLSFWHILPCDYALSVTLPSVCLFPVKMDKPVQVTSLCSFPTLMFSALSSTVLPDHPEAGLEDERCPLMTGCDRAGGQCVCDARHSCLGSFNYPDQETCMKASKSGEPSPSIRCMHTHMSTESESEGIMLSIERS